MENIKNENLKFESPQELKRAMDELLDNDIEFRNYMALAREKRINKLGGSKKNINFGPKLCQEIIMLKTGKLCDIKEVERIDRLFLERKFQEKACAIDSEYLDMLKVSEKKDLPKEPDRIKRGYDNEKSIVKKRSKLEHSIRNKRLGDLQHAEVEDPTEDDLNNHENEI